MTEKIWVIKSTFEKNSSDGIQYFTDRNELAETVHAFENAGGRVQVFKCVPIDHEVYPARIAIDLAEEDE